MHIVSLSTNKTHWPGLETALGVDKGKAVGKQDSHYWCIFEETFPKTAIPD